MAIFRARFGGGLRFLGLLALAGLSDTGSARAMGGPPTDPNDAIIWQQDIPTQFLGAAPIQFVPPAGIPTSFSAVPAGVCAVVDNNMLQIIGVGTCTVTASLTVGGGPPIQREKTFTIVPAATNKLPQAALTIDAPEELVYKERERLSATGGSTGGDVFFERLSGPCNVSGTFVSADSGTGSCEIRATMVGNDDYEDVTAEVTINLQKARQLMNWRGGFPALAGGDKYSLTGITVESGLTLSFTAAPPNVCEIEDRTTLKLISPGDCEFKAEQAGNDDFLPFAKDVEISVGLAWQMITWDQLLKAKVGDGPITLTATATSRLPVSYMATPSNVCSIVGGNELHIKGAGNCTVTASQGGNDVYAAAANGTQSFAIAKAEQPALQVVAANTMPFPGTLSLSTSGGTGTGAVTYQVSGTCTISGSILTSTGPGTCSVTATKASDGTYGSVTSSPIVVQVVSSGGVNQSIGVLFEEFVGKAFTLVDGQGSEESNELARSSSFIVPEFVQSGFAFLPQGSSTNGMIAFSGSAGQIVHAAGKGDKQVMPTSAQRPDQGYDPYVRMAGSFDIWIDGRFSWSNGADDEGGLDSKTFFTETGLDYLMTESLLIGLSLRVDNSDGTFGGEGGELEMRGWLAGPYVVWEITPGLQADAKIGYGGGHNDISAIIGGENYGGSYDTTRWRAAAGLRGELEFGSFMIEPGLRAGFYRETTEAFTLSSDGGTVGEQEFTFLRLSFDPRLTYRHRTEEGTSITPFLSPQISAEWQDAKGGGSGWDVFGVVQGGLSIATEDFSLSTTLSASGLGREGAVSYSAGANLTIPLN